MAAPVRGRGARGHDLVSSLPSDCGGRPRVLVAAGLVFRAVRSGEEPSCLLSGQGGRRSRRLEAHVPAAAWEQAAGAVAGRLPLRNAILPVLLPVRSLRSALCSVQPSQSSPQSACLTAESLPPFVPRMNPLLLGMGESVCGSGGLSM